VNPDRFVAPEVVLAEVEVEADAVPLECFADEWVELFIVAI
jgi:hypothetical protein